MADQVETAVLAVEADEASFKRSRAQFELLDARVKLAASHLDDIRRAGQNAKDGFQVTESGATRAYKALYDVRKAELDYAAAVERGAQAQGKAVQAETKRRREIEQTADASRQAREEETRRYDEQVKAARNRSGVYGALSERGTALAGLASGVGATGASQGIYLASDVLDSVEAIGRAPAELAKVAAQIGVSTAALGVAGLGAVALGGGLKLLYDQFQANKQAAEDYRNALDAQLTEDESRRAFLATATTEDVQAQVSQATAARDLAQQNLGVYGEAEAQLRAISDQWDDANAAALKAIDLGPEAAAQAQQQLQAIFAEPIKIEVPGAEPIVVSSVQELDNALKVLGNQSKQAEADIRSSQEAVDYWATALRSASLGANDAAASHERMIQATKAASQQIYDLTLERQTREETWTTEQTKSRLAAIERERAALEAQRAYLEAQAARGIDVAESLAGVNYALGVLNEETRNLTNVTMPAAEAREREAKAAEDFKKRIEEIEQGLETATDRAATYLQSMRDLSASYDKDTARTEAQRALVDQRDQADALSAALKAQRDFVAAEIKAERSGLAERQKIVDGLAADLAAEEAEGAGNRQKALADFREADTKASKDHNKRLLEISRETNKSLREALRSRDVDAAWAALERGQEQIDAESDTFAEQRDQRQQELDKQLVDLTTSLGKEADKKRVAAQDSLAALDAQLAAEQATRQQAYQDQRQADEDARRLRLDRLAEDRAIEDTQRQQAYQEQQQKLWSNLTGQDNIYKAGFDRIKATVESKFKEAVENPIVKGLASILTGSYAAKSTSPTSASSSAPVGSFTAFRQSWNRFNWNFGAYAGGGDVAPYSDILVGERGPEWLRLFNPATVYPHGQTPPAGGGEVYLTLNTQVTGVESPQDFADAFETQVLPRLASALQQFTSGQQARGYRYG